MYSKCMCRQANDAWKICFPFCFLQIFTDRHYTRSILPLKLLITEKKKGLYYYILFVLLLDTICIVDLDLYMYSKDISPELPSKIRTQLCTEERRTVFSAVCIFNTAYFLLCCADNLLLITLQVLIPQNKKYRWFKSLCIKCFMLWLTPIYWVNTQYA